MILYHDTVLYCIHRHVVHIDSLYHLKLVTQNRGLQRCIVSYDMIMYCVYIPSLKNDR